MKTYNNLWDKFISKENFLSAAKKAIKHKHRQPQVITYCKDFEGNTEKIRQLVADGKFSTGKYKTRKVYDPKERTLYILPFSPDRVIHHCIMNILKPIFTKIYIADTYACIEGRGQIAASHKCSKFVRQNKWCLKCDLRKFFPSINKEILKNKIHRVIADKKLLVIIDNIIDSYPQEKGLPIGNHTSQWFGNFYLNDHDQFVKRVLKCKCYLRYCDDFLLFSNDKSQLVEWKKIIEERLLKEDDMIFSKVSILNTAQGVDFLGYRHFGKYILLRKRTAKHQKKMIRIYEKNEPRNYENRIQSLNGWCMHACTYNFRKKLKFNEIINRLRAKK